MPYKDKEKQKEYNKAWRQAHMEERKAGAKAYYQAHREEIKAQMKAWRQEHREEKKAYQEAYNKAHREERNAYLKAYNKSDTNSFGKTKDNIRTNSRSYLFNVLKHTKIDEYEIHHCFGYDDYKKFIYIPKELHLQIHQFLRDNKIDADSNHYIQIEHIIVNYLKLKERHVLVLR